jgi:hypothetical protein
LLRNPVGLASTSPEHFMIELEELLISLALLDESSLFPFFRREALKWSYFEEVL